MKLQTDLLTNDNNMCVMSRSSLSTYYINVNTNFNYKFYNLMPCSVTNSFETHTNVRTII